MDTYRLKRIGYGAAILLGCGAAYAVFVQMTGFGFPCVFHEITGLLCPGCGVTHMCMALLQMDFRGAFLAHPVIFTLLPVWLVMVVKNAVQYIRTGSYRLSRVENGILYGSVALLLLYGVVRNLPL